MPASMEFEHPDMNLSYQRHWNAIWYIIVKNNIFIWIQIGRDRSVRPLLASPLAPVAVSLIMISSLNSKKSYKLSIFKSPTKCCKSPQKDNNTRKNCWKRTRSSVDWPGPIASSVMKMKGWRKHWYDLRNIIGRIPWGVSRNSSAIKNN